MKDINNFIIESKIKLSLNSEIKPWYHKQFPTDDCWKDLIDDAGDGDIIELDKDYVMSNGEKPLFIKNKHDKKEKKTNDVCF